ncbi:LytR/AlgR family response regulator transcription factor [Mesonia maritima]|uniref:Two-component system LytT family response regulator n=1 Tax=Mesonia maritima TaxID=1793873 RepID=A0ABU1K4L0_9FLAO|nr:LytTR family DNA-binding domain-containing protein [Mesonia maritima]MDR6300555.1 two-component system LytT family response regulator [Mesonia maritima]
MIRLVLIDDEPKAIKSIEWEIENFCEDVEVMATFTKPKKAIDYLQLHNPDCVFLDVEMSEMDGFQFLDHFKKRQFCVVFVTAYNQYAIKAIKENAMDYLLKPIDTDDLILTIEKLKVEKKNGRTYDALEERLRSHTNKRIVIPVEGKLIFINTENIFYCESDGNYCKIHLAEKKSLFISKKLKEIQAILPTDDFFRIHNSYVINLKRVSAYLKTEGYVILDNEKKIPVSRNKKSAFLDKI